MKRTRYIDKLCIDLRMGLITPLQYQEKLTKHEENLEKKRKYKKGDLIKSLDELMQQEFVYIYNKITHRRWFVNYQIGFIKYAIMRGYICKAILKELQNEER